MLVISSLLREKRTRIFTRCTDRSTSAAGGIPLRTSSDQWRAGKRGGDILGSSVLIYGMAKVLQALAKRLPIRLPAVGRIDGWWIDMVRNLAGAPIGGATIHIQSQGDEFTLSGKIYVLESPNTLRQAGWFIGQGYAAAVRNTVGYSFYGEVHGQPDVGSGYFVFLPPDHPYKNTSRAKGSFMGLKCIGAEPGAPAHHFVAEKVNVNNQAAAKNFLLEKLLTANIGLPTGAGK